MLVFLTNKAICSDMIIASLFGTLAADASASESAVEKIVLVIITFLLTTVIGALWTSFLSTTSWRRQTKVDLFRKRYDEGRSRPPFATWIWTMRWRFWRKRVKLICRKDVGEIWATIAKKKNQYGNAASSSRSLEIRSHRWRRTRFCHQSKTAAAGRDRCALSPRVAAAPPCCIPA